MKKTVLLVVMVFAISSGVFSQNTGIGTTSPTNQLHVVAATDPVRFVGMQTPGNTATGTLVTDDNGVIKIKTANTISAVRVTGTMTFTGNNTSYFNDVTATPTEVFDNLNEFSGHTFTAVQPGLYQVTFKINFAQRDNTNDTGDGYMAYAYIQAGTPTGTPLTAPSYANNGGKITLPENSGAPSYISVTVMELVKLTSGQVIQFQGLVYGSTGGNTANYTINILRVD